MAYRKNYPDRKLVFLIIDDATGYVPKESNLVIDVFYSLPFFDKNFMHLFIKSEVDFVSRLLIINMFV